MSFRRRAGLATLVVIAAAAVPPAVALGSAGDECGTVGVPPAGNVVVTAGTIGCPDAMAVVNRYLTDPSVARDGEWVRFDGWECWAPSADQAVMNGFGTECNRGMDNIQIRD
jgi:hypothetical protein